MLHKRTRSPNAYLVLAFLAAFQFRQPEASPLKENAVENGQKEATEVTIAYKPGVVELGGGPDHDPDYQGDMSIPHWYHQQQQDFQKQMRTDVKCGPEGLKFSAYGWQAKHFKDPYMPPFCPYKIYRRPYSMVLQVPYDGCNVMIKDGCYSVPLIWNGLPVTVKCPASDDSTTVAPTTYPFWYHHHHHYPGPYPYPHHYHHYPIGPYPHHHHNFPMGPYHYPMGPHPHQPYPPYPMGP